MKFKTVIGVLLLPLFIYGEFLQKGNSYYEEGSLDSAIIFYNRAVAHNENRALSYINLGNCYYRKGELANSAAFYRLSIEEAPEFFRPYYNLTLVYYLLEDYPMAVATAERALVLEPENPKLIQILASLYRDMGDITSAIIVLEQNTINSQELLLFLYELYSESGNSEKAVEILNNTEDIFEDKYLLLGHAYSEMNDLNQAELAYRKALPFGREVHYYLVDTMIKRGNIFSAITQAELSLEEYPDFINITLLAAETAMKQNWYQKAEGFYLSAYRHDDPRALIGLQNLLQIYKIHDDKERVRELNEKIDSIL